eukprot:CAMPEP_0184305314 /NCGR_PEP_ID=MMETSP1049-20130417/14627_1 /TAXON_ID=77928 /ORGANISM="Proteomonas sulcata, Strain CCMP704" /LENGTH=105 /DNA_ID=CAMNT_0026617355 /DNA_START=145 /DNA_END=462 /DNA_ORIENTATION=-
MPLMMMLNEQLPVEWPSYCGDIRFELYRHKTDPAKHYVKVDYTGGTHGAGFDWATTRTLKPDGCGGQELCELTQFASNLSKFVPKDFDKECIDPSKSEGPKSYLP